MSYYRHHVFFCTNLREDGSQCCGQCGAQSMRDYLKRRCKELGLLGPGGARINTAGCMDRCGEGPVVAVYPEGVWYTYVDREDVEEILHEHLLGGRVVDRLRLRSDPPPRRRTGG
jgi:(2Fe-2S) ferredoxin